MTAFTLWNSTRKVLTEAVKILITVIILLILSADNFIVNNR